MEGLFYIVTERIPFPIFISGPQSEGREKSDKTKFEWIELNIFYQLTAVFIFVGRHRDFPPIFARAFVWMPPYPISQQRLNHFLIVCPFLKQITRLLIARKSFYGRKMERMNRRMSRPLQLTSCFAATYSFRSRLVRSNFLLHIPLHIQSRKGINYWVWSTAERTIRVWTISTRNVRRSANRRSVFGIINEST